MKLQVLGSSSKGNCYILQTPSGKLMLECGLPYRDIQKALDFDFSDIIGVLVTHGHQDHCKSAGDMMRSGINVWMSEGAAKSVPRTNHNLQIARSKVLLPIGDFVILPFDVNHDAEEPLGYLIHYKSTGERLLFCTDTYYIKYTFEKLHYIMVECNHIEELITDNVIRDRLRKSHFSLENVKTFLMANDLSRTQKIILLHLSGDNAEPSRMRGEISNQTGVDTEIATPGKIIELQQRPF